MNTFELTKIVGGLCGSLLIFLLIKCQEFDVGDNDCETGCIGGHGNQDAWMLIFNGKFT